MSNDGCETGNHSLQTETQTQFFGAGTNDKGKKLTRIVVSSRLTCSNCTYATAWSEIGNTVVEG